jgi:hypothetical protein
LLVDRGCGCGPGCADDGVGCAPDIKLILISRGEGVIHRRHRTAACRQKIALVIIINLAFEEHGCECGNPQIILRESCFTNLPAYFVDSQLLLAEIVVVEQVHIILYRQDDVFDAVQ